ncbi:unnamed protein product [Vicia faba]|uniref:Uncharacterized protein n=1 Tax=Vicia faba TaxID=3906 RepID=A0AAV1ACF1_VICFA|nr:unnamed protein product [Vicia faba]
METQCKGANWLSFIAPPSSAHFTFFSEVLESDGISAAISPVMESNPSSEVAVLPKQSKPKKREVNLKEKQRAGIELQSFSSSKKMSQVIQIFLPSSSEFLNKIINGTKGITINILRRADKGSGLLGAFVLENSCVDDHQGHASEYGMH